VRCEPRNPLPGEKVLTVTSPAVAAPGEQTCYTIHHKHKCFTK
jgi:hypothetical protein